MSRPGRKRRAVDREPSGRPQREGVAEIKRPVMLRRCTTMGWPPTEENQRRADNAGMTTLPGRMAAVGLISQQAASGIQGYADAVVAYQRAIECPGGVKGGSMGDMPARGSIAAIFDEEGYEANVKRITADYMAAEAALLATGCKGSVQWALGVPEEVPPGDVSAHAVDTLERAGKALWNVVRVG